MKFLKFLFLCAWIASALDTAKAQGTGIHSSDKIMGSLGMFYYSDANTQGGKELPGGTTVLKSLNLQYNSAQWNSGAGIFVHSDAVGKTETQSASGIKFDFFLASLPYYFEYGYAFSASQSFKNRAAQSREGKMSFMGLGIRVALTPYFYFDGNFKQRQWTFDKEDGVGLKDAIQKTERVPYLGFGLAFNI